MEVASRNITFHYRGLFNWSVVTGLFCKPPPATAYGAAYTTVHPAGERPGVYFINHSPFAYVITRSGKLKLRYLLDQLRDTEKVTADITNRRAQIPASLVQADGLQRKRLS